MDPLTVIRTIWHHKTYVFPVILVTLIAAVYVFQFGPRYFESSMNYALVNPRLPTDRELQANPELAGLNRDNPFLRASDPALITEVLIARLNGSQTSQFLKASGLSTDYTITEGINGNGFVVSITGHGESESVSLETTRALGTRLEADLKAIQQVNGADERFLFTTLMVNPPDKATEQFSSRLRSVIMVILGGAVLMFGAVSVGRSTESVRLRRRSRTAAVTAERADDAGTTSVTAPPAFGITTNPSRTANVPLRSSAVSGHRSRRDATRETPERVRL